MGLPMLPAEALTVKRLVISNSALCQQPPEITVVSLIVCSVLVLMSQRAGSSC